ncbi:hypothetical protein [Schleiferilactobacillus harbinensis]|jgi:hypothetical protein|uniref:hypothetical protein n=1 Tax=Schleiferilactobacillus harbinensis TaxID=304207 RepID=UPI00345EAE71
MLNVPNNAVFVTIPRDGLPQMPMNPTTFNLYVNVLAHQAETRFEIIPPSWQQGIVAWRENTDYKPLCALYHIKVRIVQPMV